MRNVEYIKPSTVEEACSLLDRHGEGAKIVAGGVALAVLLKERLVEPQVLIDIEAIPSLNYISRDGGGLRLGALCTHRAIEKSALIRGKFPWLSRMAEQIGCVQVRNAGTLGGNLCHADPASDPAPALIAAGAVVNLRSSQGERSLPLEDFFIDYYQTALGDGEILTEIRIPLLPPHTGLGYMKYTLREGDMAVVGAAAAVTLDEAGERCVEARVVLGAVGPAPLRVAEAEEALRGATLGEESIRAAADAAAEASMPLEDSSGSEQYKREMVRVMTGRAVSLALQTVQ